MNIVYHQHGKFVFLKEGLSKLGHKIVPIHFLEGIPFDDQVNNVCDHADIVFFEMYGPFKLPSYIEKSKFCKVAYCIDSSMYEYFLINTMKLFDYVFVDQRSTISTLAYYGIKSSWLPLCVPDDNFRSETTKIYDITFVGSVSSDRLKRGNLLQFISNRFSLNYMQNIDLQTMQNIFSKSKIVLNENHFNGVNLRVFQALSSGSLLLTEKDSDGLELLFENEKHLVTYDRDTIVEKIEKYLSNDAYRDIAYNGYIECKNKHTSLARAIQCMYIIEKNDLRNKIMDDDRLLLAQAEAIYYRALRFGGSIKWCIDMVKQAISMRGECVGQAYTLLGALLYTCGQHDEAIRLFYTGFSTGEKLYSLSRLILYELYHNNFENAKKLLHLLIGSLHGRCDYLIKFMKNEKKVFTDETILFFTLAKILFENGNICFVGFYSKLDLNRYLPTTAVEVAYIAWKREYNCLILDFIIHCYEIKKIKIEALTLLKIAKEKGVITKRQNIIYDNLLHESYL